LEIQVERNKDAIGKLSGNLYNFNENPRNPWKLRPDKAGTPRSILDVSLVSNNHRDDSSEGSTFLGDFVNPKLVASTGKLIRNCLTSNAQNS
jgi:hypothetical protein